MDKTKHLKPNDKNNAKVILAIITRLAKSSDDPYNFIYAILNGVEDLTEDFGWLDKEK